MEGPVSLDLIEPNLYLGGLAAATDLATLTRYNITYILTLDTCPLPRHILELKTLTFKFIQVCDLPKEDLLTHLDDTEAFINQAVRDGTILVHCYFGVSRSATVVIAHIMRKYELSYAEAFERVKRKRNIVFPNPGFIAQLHLYKKMSYCVDQNSLHHKLYRLSMASDKMKRAKILPQDFFDLIKPDPGIVR